LEPAEEMAPMLKLLLSAMMSLAAAAAGLHTQVELKDGDKAPDFALPGSDGKTHKLADFKGRAVVLAWFPKAFTGG
jgi:peroxiredoxin Q/BCP